MSREKWEYASLIFENVARKITTTDPEYERLPAKTRREGERQEWKFFWWIEHSFYIWLPGAEQPDKRISWESDDEKYRTTSLEILNELGADGWEVVSDRINNSAMGASQGRDPASYPTVTKTLLKRPVDPASDRA